MCIYIYLLTHTHIYICMYKKNYVYIYVYTRTDTHKQNTLFINVIEHARKVQFHKKAANADHNIDDTDHNNPKWGGYDQ